jgi:hypothetical protein
VVQKQKPDPSSSEVGGSGSTAVRRIAKSPWSAGFVSSTLKHALQAARQMQIKGFGGRSAMCDVVYTAVAPACACWRGRGIDVSLGTVWTVGRLFYTVVICKTKAITTQLFFVLLRRGSENPVPARLRRVEAEAPRQHKNHRVTNGSVFFSINTASMCSGRRTSRVRL